MGAIEDKIVEINKDEQTRNTRYAAEERRQKQAEMTKHIEEANNIWRLLLKSGQKAKMVIGKDFIVIKFTCKKDNYELKFFNREHEAGPDYYPEWYWSWSFQEKPIYFDQSKLEDSDEGLIGTLAREIKEIEKSKKTC